MLMLPSENLKCFYLIHYQRLYVYQDTEETGYLGMHTVSPS